MQLGRYSVSTLRPPPILSITYGADGRFFTIASETGYEVWRTWPLALVRRRLLPGTLARALPLPASPLLVLQGGGAAPLYSPNKAVIYHDKLGVAVAEVEFGERIRGIAARKGTICIALLRKVIAFEYGISQQSDPSTPFASKVKGKGKEADDGFWLRKVGEWNTVENDLGLIAISTGPGTSLLALPGRQAGHIQLVHLTPCPPVSPGSTSTSPNPNPFRSPIILAHTHALSTLSCTSTGSHITTTSERGTLLRVWDTKGGRLERELRRGVDRAEMWGVVLEKTGRGRAVGWSDKGTIHVWAAEDGQGSKEGSKSSTPSSAQSLGQILSRNLPLPKYFSSTASVAQYRLPRKNPHAFSAALGAAGVNVPSMRTEEDQGELSERFVVGWVEVDVPLAKDQIEIADDRGRGEKHKSGRISIERENSTYGGAPMGLGMGMGTREERRSFGSGSDNTSRTATPTMTARRSETPTQAFVPTRGGGRRGSILSSTSRKHSANFIPVTKDGLSRGDSDRHPSSSTPVKGGGSTGGHVKLIPSEPTRRHSQAVQATAVQQRTRKENQLVAITYSGDWYRLKIPDESTTTTASEGGITRSDEDGDTGYGHDGRREGGATVGKKGGTECELVEYRRLGVGGGGW